MEITTTNVEDVINTRLRRTKEGLLVQVKVHPDVEDFFRSLAHDQHEAVRVFGKYWTPVASSDNGVPVAPPALRVWHFDWDGQKDNLLNPATLVGVGQAPNLEGRLNMSFIRLVGASGPDGVAFVWNTVLGNDELNRLASRLHRAQERFCQEFIRSTDIEVAVERRVPFQEPSQV